MSNSTKVNSVTIAGAEFTDPKIIAIYNDARNADNARITQATIVKLGRNTYRVYGVSHFAVSMLFYIKNGQPILKRVDGPKEWDAMSWGYKEDVQYLSYRAMNKYLANNAQAWELQGEVLAALA